MGSLSRAEPPAGASPGGMTRHGLAPSAAVGHAARDATGEALARRMFYDGYAPRRDARGAALRTRTCATTSSWQLLLRCLLTMALFYAASALSPPPLPLRTGTFYLVTPGASWPHAARFAFSMLVLAASTPRAAAQTAVSVVGTSWTVPNGCVRVLWCSERGAALSGAARRAQLDHGLCDRVCRGGRGRRRRCQPCPAARKLWQRRMWRRRRRGGVCRVANRSRANADGEHRRRRRRRRGCW